MSSKIITRACLAAIAVFSVLGSSTTAGANGVLVPTAVSDPTTLDIETAIAVTPSGSTRWSRIHFGGSRKALWLVPVRPGAAIDWAPDSWLDSLDDATAIRVLPPTTLPPCSFPSGVERSPLYVSSGTTQAASNVAVGLTESDARNQIAALGYRVSPTMAARIADIYGAGSVLVSVEVTSSTATGTNVSPTLRVTDDGGAFLPLALTGSDNVGARISAFVIGGTPTTIDGSSQITANDLTWGSSGSLFTTERSRRLSGGSEAWLRESSSIEALFIGVSDEHIPSLPTVVDGFFGGAACTSAAQQAAASNGTFGRVCAPGALGKVPGGAACTPTAGTIDPGSFTCGASIDLALALSGGTPSTTWVTRFSGYIPAGAFGSDVSLVAPASAKSPVIVAGNYDVCHPPVPSPNGNGNNGNGGNGNGGDDDDVSGVTYVTTSGACSGDTSTVASDDDDDDESQTSSSGCGGSSASSSSDDTNQSSDSCGGDSSTSSSDDSGWDKSDDSDCSVVRTNKKASHGKNPVSRILVAIALVLLPLRRRFR